jgi:hypothetical protein
MREPSLFDQDPDRVVGDRLRQALDGPDPEAFVARVRSAIGQTGRETSWDVLGRWAPAGLVAAGVAAVLVGMLLRPAADPTDNGSMLASAPVQMEVTPQQAESDVLTATLLEGR